MTDPQAKSLARQFWVVLQWDKRRGEPVTFQRTVERDSFTVEAGAAGVAEAWMHDDQGRLVLCVRLLDPPPGSEPYDGEVHWIQDVNLDDIQGDIAFDEPATPPTP